ncbi:Intron-binding protein aquarius [Operophtera brumata]|uniref:Intron-binding protein aquarius n=1 Tax=Operophtera brumata TaxID=104452 RepID=A0A0L7L305_OPEBR|nr:Intron-binding protein aquarius [Operophtera brumata]
MEVQLCRDQVKRLVSLSMWISLQEEPRADRSTAVPEPLLRQYGGAAMQGPGEAACIAQHVDQLARRSVVDSRTESRPVYCCS